MPLCSLFKHFHVESFFHNWKCIHPRRPTHSGRTSKVCWFPCCKIGGRSYHSRWTFSPLHEASSLENISCIRHAHRKRTKKKRYKKFYFPVPSVRVNSGEKRKRKQWQWNKYDRNSMKRVLGAKRLQVRTFHVKMLPTLTNFPIQEVMSFWLIFLFNFVFPAATVRSRFFSCSSHSLIRIRHLILRKMRVL